MDRLDMYLSYYTLRYMLIYDCISIYCNRIAHVGSYNAVRYMMIISYHIAPIYWNVN